MRGKLTLDLNIEQFLKLCPEQYIDEAAPIAFLLGKMWGELISLREDKARIDRAEELRVGIDPDLDGGWDLQGLGADGTSEIVGGSMTSLRDAIDTYCRLYDEQAAAEEVEK